MEETFTWINAVTLSIATLGAVLGVMNTWRTFDRDKVKLKVTPKRSYPVESMAEFQEHLCIEITNLSTFPLTIVEVGILYHGTSNRAAVINPLVFDGGVFPRKLEPRTSVTAHISPEIFDMSRQFSIKCAYATTDCGVTITGKSPALKYLGKKYNQAA